MIRFCCPSCQNVLEVPPERAGTKMPCSRCGQRLLVPGPADLNKTVPGQVVAAVIARQTNLAVASQPAANQTPVVPVRESRWFYVHAGQRQGPVSASQLAQSYASGQLRGSDLVWTEGMSTWEPARKAAHRFGAAPAQSPTPVAAAQPLALAPAPVGQSSSRTSLFVAVGAFGVLSILVAIGVGTALVLGARSTPTTELQAGPTGPTATTSVTLPGPKSVEEIAQECSPSVARVITPLGHGSGFLVDGGLVVTNWHVLADAPADSIRVSFPQGPEASRTPALAELVYVNPKRDIAVLRLDARLPALKVASGPAFKAGERIVVIGSPGVGGGEVLENAVTDGILSSQKTLRGLNWYHITAAINPGNSGGPVFNPRGEVVGVVTFYIDGKQTMNFAVPADDVRKAIEDSREPTREDLEARAANHNASVVFSRLHKACDLHFQTIKEINTAMNQAQKAGRSPSEAHQAALNEREAVRRRRQVQNLLSGLEAVQAQVGRSSYPPPALRHALQDFWALHKEIEKHVISHESMAAFQKKSEALALDYLRQRSNLQGLTGITVVD